MYHDRHTRGNILRNLKVHICSENYKFTDTWGAVLEVAGCDLLARLPGLDATGQMLSLFCIHGSSTMCKIHAYDFIPFQHN